MKDASALAILNDPGETIDALERDIYVETYGALLQLAECVVTWTDRRAAFKALACAAYGWMPTSLKDLSCDPKLLADTIRLTRDDPKTARARAIQMLERWKAPPVNSSWIGTSKALHFIRPDVFPIWDSRIGRLFGLSYNAAVNKKSNYLEYFSFMHDRVNEHRELPPRVREKLGADTRAWTDLRCLEILLFTAAKVRRSKQQSR